MAAATHTPAPWTADLEAREVRADSVLRELRVIAVIHRDDAAGSNTRLVAAAPELLAAAERGVAALAANGAPNCEAAKELRAAIAKARGES